jgi:hypothetical protein
LKVYKIDRNLERINLKEVLRETLARLKWKD